MEVDSYSEWTPATIGRSPSFWRSDAARKKIEAGGREANSPPVRGVGACRPPKMGDERCCREGSNHGAITQVSRCVRSQTSSACDASPLAGRWGCKVRFRDRRGTILGSVSRPTPVDCDILAPWRSSRLDPFISGSVPSILVPSARAKSLSSVGRPRHRSCIAPPRTRDTRVARRAATVRHVR